MIGFNCVVVDGSILVTDLMVLFGRLRCYMPIVVLFPTSDVCTYLMTQNERENELVVQQQGSVVGPRIHQPQQENALWNAMIMVLMVIIRIHQPQQEYALWKGKKQG